MSVLRNSLSLLWVNLATDLARPRHLLLTFAGFFIASLALVGLFAIPAGLERVAGSTGQDDVALILAADAQDEASSRLPKSVLAILSTLPGIARDKGGRALVAAQFIASAKLRRADGSVRRVQVRGVDDATWQLLGSQVRLSKGKQPGSGLNELVVGSALYQSYVGLAPGSRIEIRHSPWHVLGGFTVPGSLWDSELWADAGALKSTFNVRGGASVIWARLTSPDAFERLADAIASDARLSKVRAVPQRDYYQKKMGFLVHFARIAAWGIAVTLGLGAILAIANALFMALAARQRETATLRAMGFAQAAIALATFLEVVLIGIVSTMMSIALAWLVLDGASVTTATTSQSVMFTFSVDGSVVSAVLLCSVAVGLVAALWPTVRMIRSPLVAALRAG